MRIIASVVWKAQNAPKGGNSGWLFVFSATLALLDIAQWSLFATAGALLLDRQKQPPSARGAMDAMSAAAARWGACIRLTWRVCWRTALSFLPGSFFAGATVAICLKWIAPVNMGAVAIDSDPWNRDTRIFVMLLVASSLAFLPFSMRAWSSVVRLSSPAEGPIARHENVVEAYC